MDPAPHQYDIRPARSDADLRQIVALQAANLHETVEPAERAAQGFVTLKHDLPLLREMCGTETHVVATERRSGDVVAYALVMLPAFRTRLPLLAPMFARLENLSHRGRPLLSFRWYVMGQVCVARAHRGRALVERMYAEHRRLMSPRYDLMVTEIDRANPRSLRVHEKSGWIVLDAYQSDGREWVVVGKELEQSSMPDPSASTRLSAAMPQPQRDCVLIGGSELLAALTSGSIHEAKMAFNDRGAIVFPVSRQHREMKADGISYEDDYKGNALAAMLRRDAIEVRFHQAFKDADVARIVAALLALPEFAAMRAAHVTYQGRVIMLSPKSP